MVTTEDPPSELPHPASAHNDATGLSGTAHSVAGHTTEDSTLDAESELLALTVKRPASGICVVTVDGELDMLTAPVLEAYLREQLSTDPRHLIVDLQQVSFGLQGNARECTAYCKPTTPPTPPQHSCTSPA